jgi:hypothetical protein
MVVAVVGGSVVVATATVDAEIGTEGGVVAGVPLELHPTMTNARTVTRTGFPAMATPYGLEKVPDRGREGSFSRTDIFLYRG